MALILAIMARRQAYTLAFASAVTTHLHAINAKYHALIGEKIGEQLRFERLLMAYSPHLRAILERSRQQYREGQWLGEEEFWS
jgi:hypothetical protein